ncbi:hypothetical protein, partial [Streptomyces sp. NPDC058667]|uniref:hypothetical protein n=1 Tax=Streptomyces sp. NPDC058667 TaxID=3346588 RepID=UPI0036626126
MPAQPRRRARPGGGVHMLRRRRPGARAAARGRAGGFTASHAALLPGPALQVGEAEDGGDVQGAERAGDR